MKTRKAAKLLISLIAILFFNLVARYLKAITFIGKPKIAVPV